MKLQPLGAEGLGALWYQSAGELNASRLYGILCLLFSPDNFAGIKQGAILDGPVRVPFGISCFLVTYHFQLCFWSDVYR